MRKNWETQIAGMPITLRQSGVDSFRVTYFKQVKNGLTYAAAAKELGQCIMHALACDGMLDTADDSDVVAAVPSAPRLPTWERMDLRTPYGAHYIIHKNGDIQRTDIEGFKPSGQWRLLGLVLTHPFSTGFVPLADITPEWLAAHPLKFKNGKPRYTGHDFDHGTRRTWGNTEYHGIASLELHGVAE